MKQYKGYLIDLDGTMYFGKQRIPTAEKFVLSLLEREEPFLFVTNNATRSPEMIAENLRQEYDLPIGVEHVHTSTMTLIDYMRDNHVGESVFVVGEEPLHRQVAAAGFTITQTPDAQVVVQGLNRQTNYQELAQAATAIRQGAAFLVTNTDQTLPTEHGLMPSSGALTAFLEVGSGKVPIVMGKPFKPVVEAALARLNLEAKDVLMIGDKYETDIQVGINAGMDTLMVLTGVTQLEDLRLVADKPTYVLNDLSEWDFPLC